MFSFACVYLTSCSYVLCVSRDLCVCMRDVISEFNSMRLRDHMRLVL